MSIGILVDWSGASARTPWSARLPAAAAGPAALDRGPHDGDDLRREKVAPSPVPPSRLLQLDRLAAELRAAHDRLALPLARVAAAFVAAKAWRPCGAARLEDHARERFGRTGRWVRHCAELGGALERWPDLARALTGDDGGVPLGAEAVRLVARVVDATVPATPSSAADGEATLARWIARARELPLRVLRREVRAVLSGGAGVCVSVEAGAGDALGDPDLDDEPRCVVEFRLPAPIRAAFEEVIDLHRALAGRDGSLAEAIDALLAESMSGGLADALARSMPGGLAPVGADRRGGSDALGIARRPAGRGRARAAAREERLARATGRWAHLPSVSPAGPDTPPDDLLRRAASSLAEFRLLAACAGHGGPLALNDQLARLVALEDALMRRLGEIALEFSRRGAWATLGFVGIGHYAEARLRLPATVLEDRVAVARRLMRFPRLRDAYERGVIGLDALLTVLRTLGRGPVPDDVECAWLARAREATVKRLRDEARALARRDLELEPALAAASPSAERHAPPLPLPDAAWAAALYRAPGLVRRRVLQAGLLALDPGPDVFLRLRLPEALADDLLAAVEAARRGLTALADSVPWSRDWPDEPALPSVLAARTFSVRGRRVPAWVGLLALLEEAAGTWDDPRDCARRPGDPVYRRDGYRCAAPGCTARAAIEDHHVVFRSRGGSDAPGNRVALCAAHHAALHEHGTLAVEGSAPLGLTWTAGATPAAVRYRCERRL
ncbi:MAG: hypothetical protein MUF27_10900 [Acidobacteria bacterium]|jgi:hypothetical protein|nr:hypothetical protein [Acidobacteriota bacterium]